MSREEQLKKLYVLARDLEWARIEVQSEFTTKNEHDKDLCDEAEKLCQDLVLQHYSVKGEVLRRCQEEGFNPFLDRELFPGQFSWLRPGPVFEGFMERREAKVRGYRKNILDGEHYLNNILGPKDWSEAAGMVSWLKELAGDLAEAELMVEAMKQEVATRA